MIYTHIGIGDQAKAVGNLSVPKAPPKPATSAAPAKKPALHGRCISGGFGRLSLSSDGSNASPKKRQNPCVGKGFDAVRRRLSSGGKVEAAGIEPGGSCSVSVDKETGYANCQVCGAANALQPGGNDCPGVSPIDTELQAVIEAWDTLPEGIRQAIATLVASQK